MKTKASNSQLKLSFSEHPQKNNSSAAPATLKCKVVDMYSVTIERTREIAAEQLSKLGLIKKNSQPNNSRPLDA
jgi:hypothetical protein